MTIQALNSNNRNNYSRKRQVNFRETPARVLGKLATKSKAEICDDQRKFFTDYISVFQIFKDRITKSKVAPDGFEYKLGEKNVIPKGLNRFRIGGINLKEFDNILNSGGFACSSNCACGKGKNTGQFILELCEKLGVEKPGVIDLSKNKN